MFSTPGRISPPSKTFLGSVFNLHQRSNMTFRWWDRTKHMVLYLHKHSHRNDVSEWRDGVMGNKLNQKRFVSWTKLFNIGSMHGLKRMHWRQLIMIKRSNKEKWWRHGWCSAHIHLRPRLKLADWGAGKCSWYSKYERRYDSSVWHWNFFTRNL